MSEWIPVDSGKRPKIGEEVIVCGVNRFGGKYVLTSEYWGGDAFCLVNPQDITHWMPLPEPPEASK